jgi:hypothetical protein
LSIIYEYRAHLDNIMASNEKTSKSVASKAAKVLRNPKATKAQKSVAASALTQAPDRKKGGKKKYSPLDYSSE